MAEQSLKNIPERELQRTVQMWLNNEANLRADLYRYGVGDTSFTRKHSIDVQEAIEPMRVELRRRARLVMK